MPKRVYGGLQRPRKRMRYTRKRRTYRRRAMSKYSSTQKGRATSTMFRTRRQPYRVYRRQLYNSLKFKESSRSIRTLSAFPFNFTLTGLDKKYWGATTIDNAFYTTAGGYTGSNTFATSKFTIKGGVVGTVLRNTETTPIIVEWCVVRYLDDEYTIDNTETEYIADLSTFNGFGKSFRMISRMKRVVLEPGDTVDMRCRIPFTVINNIDEWTNSAKGKIGLVYAVQAPTIGAVSLPRLLSHNLTFVGDAVT